MSPKSLLRHPKCLSYLDDFVVGGFKEIIDDELVEPSMINKLVFCSGKLYYELLQERNDRGIEWHSFIRAIISISKDSIRGYCKNIPT